jgi:hypothetical protein
MRVSKYRNKTLFAKRHILAWCFALCMILAIQWMSSRESVLKLTRSGLPLTMAIIVLILATQTPFYAVPEEHSQAFFEPHQQEATKENQRIHF